MRGQYFGHWSHKGYIYTRHPSQLHVCTGVHVCMHVCIHIHTTCESATQKRNGKLRIDFQNSTLIFKIRHWFSKFDMDFRNWTCGEKNMNLNWPRMYLSIIIHTFLCTIYACIYIYIYRRKVDLCRSAGVLVFSLINSDWSFTILASCYLSVTIRSCNIQQRQLQKQLRYPLSILSTTPTWRSRSRWRIIY
jgi:hypothetical protein